jgi:hypothetical protein
VVDVDVHEMLTSIVDLDPYREEPWRGGIEINDGFRVPPGNPCAFPQPTGVAIRDAVTHDGSPAGFKLGCSWHGFEFDLETGGDR